MSTQSADEPKRLTDPKNGLYQLSSNSDIPAVEAIYPGNQQSN